MSACMLNKKDPLLELSENSWCESCALRGYCQLLVGNMFTMRVLSIFVQLLVGLYGSLRGYCQYLCYYLLIIY